MVCGNALSDPDVEVIERTSFVTDEHIVRTRHRILDLLIVQLFQASMLVKDDSLPSTLIEF